MARIPGVLVMTREAEMTVDELAVLLDKARQSVADFQATLDVVFAQFDQLFEAGERDADQS